MKVFLLGMPGSGKSTLGNQVAGNLNLKFIDLDACIEEECGKSIPEIFQQDGEDYFRQKEGALLRKHSSEENNFIMSTGGGVPCFNENIEFMNQTGITVYLNVSLDELFNRLLETSDHRPLLAQSESLHDTIADLLAERTIYYNQASISINSNSISANDIEERLIRN